MWTFFPLVKQHNIKTTLIFWSTQSRKKEKDKCLASTEHCILFSLQLCSIVGVIDIHRQEKQNNITSIPKLSFLHKTKAMTQEALTSYSTLL
jgi:hypothetical protein